MVRQRKQALFVQYTNPAGFPPLENSSKILADSGWQVKFIGTEAVGVENIKLPDHPNIQVELAPVCGPGLKQKIHYLKFVLRSLREAFTGEYSVLYVSDLFSCPVGWLASRWLKLKVFYHEHDTPESSQSLFVRGLLWTRKQLAHRATVCIFPQRERAQRFLTQFKNCRTEICYNMPLKASAWIRNSETSHKEFKLWYHGSLVPGRLPSTVLEALALLPPLVSLHFAGYETLSYPQFIEQFFDRAQELGVHERVVYRGSLSREPLFAAARECDLGLVLFASDFGEPMVGASNKPFDYMACGLPLLINDSQEWSQFFEKAGVAESCNPEKPATITAAVQRFLDSPEKWQRMSERGVQKIALDWNYESQFASIRRLLEASVS
jgi:glycosyltransferase involved in cell wall biosynthesis